MRPSLLAALLLAAPLAAQPITLAPYPAPPGGSVTGLEVTTLGTVVMLQDGVLFASQDRGSTWQQPLGSTRFSSLEKFPSDTLVVRGAGETYVSADGKAWQARGSALSRALRALATPQGWFVIEGDSVRRSADEGATWDVVRAGLPEQARPRALAQTPGGQVFLTTWYRDYYLEPARGSIYAWRDTAWVARTIAPECGSDLRIEAPTFASEDVGIAFATVATSWNDEYTALVTVDGGHSWSCPARGLSAATAGADGQLYRAHYATGEQTAHVETSPDGKQWRPFGLEGVMTTTMRLLPDGTLLAGSGLFYVPDAYETLYGDGLYRVEKGKTAEGLRPDVATSRVLALMASRGTLHAVTPQGAWQFDGGAWQKVRAVKVVQNEWERAERNPAYHRVAGITRAPWDTLYYVTQPLAIPTKQGDPAAAAVLALGDSTLIAGRSYPAGRSTNRGQTWTDLGIEADLFVEAGGVLAAGKQIWHSADGGATWASVWKNDTLYVEALAADATAPRAYAVVGRFPRPSFLLRSTGAPGPDMTWEPVAGSTVPPGTGWGDNSIHVAGNRLFFASSYALHVSTDEGVTWAPVYAADPDKLNAYPYPYTPPRPLPFALDAEGYLVVAAAEGGLLRSTTPVGAERAARPAPAALHVVPNPARGAVTIHLDAQSGRVEIFDLMGRRVAVVAGGPLGEAVSWDASGLPAGLYVVRVVGAHGTQSAPFVVAR